jgi:hypothetical protein
MAKRSSVVARSATHRAPARASRCRRHRPPRPRWCRRVAPGPPGGEGDERGREQAAKRMETPSPGGCVGRRRSVGSPPTPRGCDVARTEGLWPASARLPGCQWRSERSAACCSAGRAGFEPASERPCSRMTCQRARLPACAGRGAASSSPRPPRQVGSDHFGACPPPARVAVSRRSRRAARPGRSAGRRGGWRASRQLASASPRASSATSATSWWWVRSAVRA